MRSKVPAISPFVDKLMLLIKKCRCAPANETDIEIALREALENAVIHGNHEDPRKHVYVRCRCKAEEEVSITVKDEGKGFDSNALPDPAAPGAIELSHGRGTYLMKAFMDEVRFEQSRAVVHMRKKSGNSQPDPPKEVCDEGHDTRLQTFLFVWGEKSGLRLAGATFSKMRCSAGSPRRFSSSGCHLVLATPPSCCT